MSPVLTPLADITSPFYLHPGQSPALVLVSTPLTETNYYSWLRVMRLALHSKDKLGFINGGIPEPPPGDPLIYASKCNKTMVMAWITRSVSTEIAQSIISLKSMDRAETEVYSRKSHKDCRFTRGDLCSETR